MKFLPGVANASNGLTKPPGWVLHSRHAKRAMGHCNLGSNEAPEALEPGRVSEPEIEGSATETNYRALRDEKVSLANPEATISSDDRGKAR